jgi:hypothetical protein
MQNRWSHGSQGLMSSPKTMSHILRGVAAVKNVDGIPMQKDRVLADPNQVDESYAKLEAMIRDVPRVSNE